jgi:hypothetical protein
MTKGLPRLAKLDKCILIDKKYSNYVVTFVVRTHNRGMGYHPVHQ